MRLPIGRWAGRALLFVVIVFATAQVTSLVASRLSPTPLPPAIPASVYTAERLEKATQRFTGHVADPIRQALVDDTTLAMVLKGRDIKGCEDLGRQLRTLRRAAPDRPITVWTEGPRIAELRRFLHRERVSNVRVEAVDTRQVLAGGLQLATPAAMLVLRDGRIVQGIAHPSRFPNMRQRSFAEELTLLGFTPAAP